MVAESGFPFHVTVVLRSGWREDMCVDGLKRDVCISRGVGPSKSSMAKATWENAVLAESDGCVEVEGNQYFPEDSIHKEFFQPSSTQTVCPWKGTAKYYDVVVNGQRNKDAAWYYPEPSPAAKQIKDRVAFWKGVKVVK